TSTEVLIHLSAVSPDLLEPTLSNLAAAFAGYPALVAIPETAAPNHTRNIDSLRVLPYTPAATSTIHWVHPAADYLSAYKLMQEQNVGSCLMLGPDSQTMQPESIRRLAEAMLATSADLVVSHYQLGAHEGLVNSGILYPLSRALFCAQPRFPLAIDIGISPRMAERLAIAAQRFTAINQDDALLWPVSEAAMAGFTMTEVEVPSRTAPQPTNLDLNALLGQILGSLFSDIDARASFWQRLRTTIPPRTVLSTPESGEQIDVTPMLDAFHLAYSNLHEIWALVLPPHTLLGLKRLSVMPRESFRFADSLWARILYDFVLAYRLRTINRGHLLGALTPLYLAWVASHLLLVQSGIPPEKHIEELAQAFEVDKPYLVSRWRWPDRFNP
ncbi:MAG TPA: hypothetical protein VFS41_09115, partial [Edaphobacter sp.]|nr:hypothetical protein [Edaphobacter sp.]